MLTLIVFAAKEFVLLANSTLVAFSKWDIYFIKKKKKRKKKRRGGGGGEGKKRGIKTKKIQ